MKSQKNFVILNDTFEKNVILKGKNFVDRKILGIQSTYDFL